MRGLYYQLKNIRRDKMCILTFLLPIVVGLALNLLSGVNLSSIAQVQFGVVQSDLSLEMEGWLESNGHVDRFISAEELFLAVNDPATQMIGVMRDGESIKTFLSGDELLLYKGIGNALPSLYLQRAAVNGLEVEILPQASNSEWLKALLVAITLVTAMFMGCTYNAMNIIGEQEDGISYINEILPITRWNYLKQKIVLGLFGGVLSTAITALICINIKLAMVVPLLLFITLSAGIAALAGLFVGKASNGLMMGIAYIKILMILFIAPPILFYLLTPSGSVVRTLSYLLPSSATFYGLMELLEGEFGNVWWYILILLGHCIVWLCVYLKTRASIISQPK